ncbi:hypothetical protein OBBRIDRAFT_265491 [Obba rivulosa]|uniref:Uncharacterized protein n=1 Tax=Obba rivulosa TaxID=1052685 RepID=A0A8E2DQ86_9APHY|nr:hypothetical protein OBBRIDRAFT_265491 [Obba rivulosa]
MEDVQQSRRKASNVGNAGYIFRKTSASLRWATMRGHPMCTFGPCRACPALLTAPIFIFDSQRHSGSACQPTGRQRTRAESHISLGQPRSPGPTRADPARAPSRARPRPLLPRPAVAASQRRPVLALLVRGPVRPSCAPSQHPAHHRGLPASLDAPYTSSGPVLRQPGPATCGSLPVIAPSSSPAPPWWTGRVKRIPYLHAYLCSPSSVIPLRYGRTASGNSPTNVCSPSRCMAVSLPSVFDLTLTGNDTALCVD